MAWNIENYQKINGCPNVYTKNNFAFSFYVNEDESKVCSKCGHFTYTNGIASCDLITGVFESENGDDNNSTITEKL